MPLKTRLRSLLVRATMQAANYAFILLLGLAVGAVIILFSGKNPIHAYGALFRGAFGSLIKTADTLDRASVLILSGLAASVAFGTSVWNLGLEGQLYVGAFAAAWVGFSIHGLPAALHIPLALLAGTLAGALWSLPAIVLKLVWNVNELVTTLMLNYIAILGTAYLVAFPFKSPTAFMPGTDTLDATARLPRLIPGSILNIGFLIALVLAFVAYWFIYRTKMGYELRMVGFNPRFAGYAGMPVKRSAFMAMMLSGALVGLGGAVVITGFFGRFISSFSVGYGWDGMLIALLARNHPLGVLPASLFYAALANGALSMQSATGVPQALVTTVKGTIMFFVTAQFLIELLNRRMRKWMPSTP
jgi:simple sugar transport system permease protein